MKMRIPFQLIALSCGATGQAVIGGGASIPHGPFAATSLTHFIASDGVFVISLVDGGSFGSNITDHGEIRWIAPGTNTQAANSVFSGTGTMLVTAPTITILLGNNTFTGGTTIDTHGNVFVGNPHSKESSPFGNGALTLDNGTIDTIGSRSHRIAVGGYVQTGGVIAIRLGGTSPDDHTRYDVTGTAELSGGTVRLYDLSGNYIPQDGDTQNIIATTGGIVGEFASNTPEARFYNTAFEVDLFYHQGDTLLHPTVTYDADNANITWIQDPFRSVPGLTANQDAVGGGLDGLADANIITFLNGQDIGELPGMFDLIAPEELTAIFRMGFTASEIRDASIRRHLDRVRQGQGGLTESKGGMVLENKQWSAFIEGTGESATVDGNLNASRYDFDSMGVTAGADRRVGDNLAIGVLAAYGQSDARLINGGRIEAEGFNGAVYATVFNGGFFLDALLGAGGNSYETRRASMSGYAEGTPDGWEFSAMVNTGYDFRRGNWTFTPTASLAYTRVTLDGFSETGSLTPLSYADQHQDSLRSEIGGSIAYTARLGGVTLTPQVRIAWQHEFMDSTRSITSGFKGGSGPTFTVDGPHIDSDRAVLSAGITAQITHSVCIYGFFDGRIDESNFDSNQFSVGVKVDF